MLHAEPFKAGDPMPVKAPGTSGDFNITSLYPNRAQSPAPSAFMAAPPNGVTTKTHSREETMKAEVDAEYTLP